MTSYSLLTGALVGAVVAMIGWGVSHSLALRRERDKVRREILSKDIDFILDLVRELLEMALDYHSSKRDKQNERKIIIFFKRLGQRVSNLPLHDAMNSAQNILFEHVIDFKITVTKTHFEEDHKGPLPAGSDLFDLCQFYAAQVENDLLKARTLCYEPLLVFVINRWSGSNFSDQR